jgi:hypothetical protein
MMKKNDLRKFARWFEKSLPMTALIQFANQRPELNPADYGIGSARNASELAEARKAYRSDSRRISKAKSEIAIEIRCLESYADEIAMIPDVDFPQSSNRRLCYDSQNQRWDYTKGQKFPVEYRPAVLSVLKNLNRKLMEENGKI